MIHALYASVFVIAACGLSYELIAGTLASYLLGDSVLQFSTIIGAYLFAMGVGSYLSRHIRRHAVLRFIEIEIAVGLLGGFSTSLLLTAYAHSLPFRFCLYLIVFLIGVLVGIEIPLLIGILKEKVELRHLVSQVLTLDYVGALIVSILFPLYFVSHLGLVRSALVFGLANVGVACLGLWVFRESIGKRGPLHVAAAAAIVLLSAGGLYAQRIYSYAEERLYNDEIVFAKTTPYQRIVLTRYKDDLRLFLNSQLQFSTRDEYRYHECLVHPALAAIKRPRRVLVLGGGDGLAVREILKDSRVETITLVDLDPEMTALFKSHPELVAINNGSLSSDKVRIVNADAFVWLDRNDERFDFIAIDFPDPGSYSLGKLYTTAFYRLIKKRLNPGGLFVVQATSPLFARKSFWCIEKTIRSAGFKTTPMHVYVPSFGEWGFVLGGGAPYSVPEKLSAGLRYLNPQTTQSLFEFPEDMSPVAVEINQLDNQILVHYYESEWARIGE